MTRIVCPAAFVALGLACAFPAFADGKLVPPRAYEGSLEETAQEAILVFQEGDEARSAREDLILKITVKGGALSEFAWVVPFPAPPDIHQEDAVLFRELFQYVEARRAAQSHGKALKSENGEAKSAAAGVDVLARQVVGSYDTAVVRETQRGALNAWLASEGFRPLADADDVLDFYRRKDYVFACLKVSDAALESGSVDLHPLRFSFETRGRDGIYFPMRLTGLQTEPFHVNLYVFHRFWINDRLSRFGYVHRDFRLHYRDWDSPACTPNAGKSWEQPESDPFLKSQANLVPGVAEMLRRLRPGGRFYLTNIQAGPLNPADVRAWSDDLRLYPYYTDRDFVPYDARSAEPPSAAGETNGESQSNAWRTATLFLAGAATGIGLLLGVQAARRTAASNRASRPESAASASADVESAVEPGASQNR